MAALKNSEDREELRNKITKRINFLGEALDSNNNDILEFYTPHNYRKNPDSRSLDIAKRIITEIIATSKDTLNKL